MDSDELTTEQAGLSRVVKRMERTGFPPNDPLFKSARRAYDGVSSFSEAFRLNQRRMVRWKEKSRPIILANSPVVNA